MLIKLPRSLHEVGGSHARRKRFKSVPLLLSIALFSACAAAQEVKTYPSKSIRMIVGYAPGGGADIMGRLIGSRISEALGQQVVIENRPGAGQNIGAEAVSRAAPDGYTLFLSSSALGINVSLYPKLSYDPIKSFVPIAVFAQSPNLLLVHPSMPVTAVKDFIAFAKRNPGKLNFSSSGSGSTQHLSGELLKLATGVRMTHIPYKGSAPSLTALASGEVDFAFNNIPSSQPLLQQRRIKALALTSRDRSPILPDVPTLRESGLKDFDVAAWYGVLAPAGTAADIVVKLNGVINATVRGKEFNEQLAKMGADAIIGSPEYFARFLQVEIDLWREVIQAAGTKPE